MIALVRQAAYGPVADRRSGQNKSKVRFKLTECGVHANRGAKLIGCLVEFAAVHINQTELKLRERPFVRPSSYGPPRPDDGPNTQESKRHGRSKISFKFSHSKFGLIFKGLQT